MAKRRPSGDGMVRKREDGRWEGRIVVGHKANGDSIFRYIYADNQKELTAKLRQNIDAYQGVDLTEDCRMTLAEWLDCWLEQMALTLRPGTLKRYRGDMDRHVKPRLGQKRLTQLTAEDLRELYRFLLEQGRIAPRPGQGPGLSPATVRGIHAALHQALQAAADQCLIPNNPTKQVDPPKITHKPMKILNEEQMDTFLAAVDGNEIWRDFFYTELTTGLRLGAGRDLRPDVERLRWAEGHSQRLPHPAPGKRRAADSRGHQDLRRDPDHPPAHQHGGTAAAAKKDFLLTLDLP